MTEVQKKALEDLKAYLAGLSPGQAAADLEKIRPGIGPTWEEYVKRVSNELAPKTMENEIERLKNEIKQLESVLLERKEMLKQAIIEDTKKSWPVIGTIMTDGTNKGIFSGLEYSGGKAVPIISKIKTDGTASKFTHWNFNKWVVFEESDNNPE